MTKAAAKRIRITGWILFGLYVAAMIYFLFLAEWYGRSQGSGEPRYNLMPFREIRRFWRYRGQIGTGAVFLNLAGNGLGFIPFGAILPVLRRHLRSVWRIGVLSFVLSAQVEVIQLLTRLGSFDVDDIMLNTLGGVIGYGIFAVCNRLRRHYYG